MYNPWRYEIDAKFETDWSLFPSERSKVNYALTQMENPVFDAMQGWGHGHGRLRLSSGLDGRSRTLPRSPPPV